MAWARPALARRLADSLSADLVLEEVEENPFLERFYRDGAALRCRRRCSSCLRARARSKSCASRTCFPHVRVSDYLFAKDRLFAELNLDPDELELYDQVADNLAVEAAGTGPRYLSAGVGRYAAAAHRASRHPYERLIDRRYLERLTDAYARFFHAYDDGPLLIVNASQIDPVNNDADYEQLFQQIERTTGGRHFFNPVAAALA